MHMHPDIFFNIQICAFWLHVYLDLPHTDNKFCNEIIFFLLHSNEWNRHNYEYLFLKNNFYGHEKATAE